MGVTAFWEQRARKGVDMLKRWAILLAVAASLFLPLLSDEAAAETYPQGAVTVWHPFEPTPYDALSKVYNSQMEKNLGVPFLFEYGMMGKAAKAVLDTRPDGRNVYFAAMGPMVLKPNMVAPVYEPKDFRCVARATLLPILFVAGKDAPFKTFREFEEYARNNPGKASIGLTNFPSSLHVGMTHFIKNIAKLDVKLVEQADGPVRGTIDCLIGYTDALISHPPDIMRYIRSGHLVPLATFNAERLEMLPDVPTLHELGYDFDQTSWRLIVVNKDTPDEIVKILSEATKKAMESPEMQRSAKENYEILSYLPPKEADAFLQKEFDYYKQLSLTLGMHYSQKK